MMFLRSSARDKRQNLFCKCHDHTASECQKAVAAQGRVVTLEGQTDLDNAPAEKDQPHRTDHAENKIGQVAAYPILQIPVITPLLSVRLFGLPGFPRKINDRKYRSQRIFHPLFARVQDLIHRGRHR